MSGVVCLILIFGSAFIITIAANIIFAYIRGRKGLHYKEELIPWPAAFMGPATLLIFALFVLFYLAELFVKLKFLNPRLISRAFSLGQKKYKRVQLMEKVNYKEIVENSGSYRKQPKLTKVACCPTCGKDV